MSSQGYNEDEVGRKLDRCLTDGVLKLAGGVFLGSVFSLLFFRRRKWPIIMGAGFGIGMAYANFENDMNSAVAQCPRPTVKPVKN